jgi:hypothetical protein
MSIEPPDLKAISIEAPSLPMESSVLYHNDLVEDAKYRKRRYRPREEVSIVKRETQIKINSQLIENFKEYKK